MYKSLEELKAIYGSELIETIFIVQDTLCDYSYHMQLDIIKREHQDLNDKEIEDAFKAYKKLIHNSVEVYA